MNAKTLQACDRYLSIPHLVFKIPETGPIVWRVRCDGKTLFQSSNEDSARNYFEDMQKTAPVQRRSWRGRSIKRNLKRKAA